MFFAVELRSERTRRIRPNAFVDEPPNSLGEQAGLGHAVPNVEKSEVEIVRNSSMSLEIRQEAASVVAKETSSEQLALKGAT